MTIEEWEKLDLEKRKDIFMIDLMGFVKDCDFYKKEGHDDCNIKKNPFHWGAFGSIIYRINKYGNDTDQSWPPYEIYFCQELEDKGKFKFTITRGMAHWAVVAEDAWDAAIVCFLNLIKSNEKRDRK
jgi:hypothetical protein